MKIHTKRQGLKRESSDTENPYKHRISFYTTPPSQEITLVEFERFAIDRLRVLKEIDSLKSRNANPEDFKKRMKSVIPQYLPLPEKDNLDEIRKDVISHYVLRLAYCRPNDRTWFVTQERELLKFRLQESASSLETFITQNGIYFPEVKGEELQNLSTDLEKVKQSLSNDRQEPEQSYYKVPFQDALDLVQKRKVLLKNGLAYVGRNDLISLILTDFRSYLNHSLAVTYKHFPEFQNDSRVSSLIELLPKQYLGREYILTDNKDEVKLEDLDTVAKQHFPPCMQNMHSHLRSRHHLKYFGRLSYSLFLKGIGVSLDSALIFWREELETKGGRNFDKEFAYNIKHGYGKVGKQQSYTPYACHKIIEEPPVEGGVHGCPFKNDKGNLKSMLASKGISATDGSEIIKLANEGQYQIACKCLFDLQHPGHRHFELEAINHPNRFFDLSIQYLKEKKDTENMGMVVEKNRTEQL